MNTVTRNVLRKEYADGLIKLANENNIATDYSIRGQWHVVTFHPESTYQWQKFEPLMKRYFSELKQRLSTISDTSIENYGDETFLWDNGNKQIITHL